MAEKSIINTFEKGLHQDSSFILQPDGTYRNLKNGMLISHDGNHFVLEISKGNKVILTLPKRYTEDVDTLDNAPMPIGFISYIDKLAVFFTNNEGSGGYGEIGLISFTKIGDDFTSTYTPYYHHEDLNFSLKHKIEGFSFEENDLIQRTYWTDWNNEPRVFDFANPIFTDYKVAATSGELENGKQYMVLQGAIVYDSNEYGPTDASGSILGNIFTATTAGGTSFAVSDGTPLVIEYYSINLLDWIPSRALGNMKFKAYGTGNKYCGNNIYFYRLSSSSGGITTSWSYGSNPIHVGMENESAYIAVGNDYVNFVGNGSISTLENSGRSVIFTISNIDTTFDTIEVAVMEFDQKTDIPYATKIIVKSDVTGSEMDITDNGSTSLGDVTVADLTLFPANILKIKTLTTNKNYIVIGNTTEREEFEIDLSGVTATAFNYPMNSHGDIGSTSCASAQNIFDSISPVAGANPGAGDIEPWSRWLVTLGEASPSLNTVTYNGVEYLTGEVIVGVTADDTISFGSVTAAARPCTTRNRYTKISDGSRTEDAIELNSPDVAFWDYKDPAVASHNKGYWSGEKYRKGILFFDLKGNPYYVKWIADVDMPTVSAKGGLLNKTANASGLFMYSLNASGINISGLDIPASIIDNVSGFSIVRAERDGIIISQGLLMQNVLDTGTSPESVYPLALARADMAVFPTYTEGICTVLCPDDLVGYDFGDFPVGTLGQFMKEAFWLEGDMLKTDGPQARDGNYQSMYTKLFNLVAPDADSPRTFELTSMNGDGSRTLNEGDASTNFDGSGRNYINLDADMNHLAINAAVDNYCSDNGLNPGPYGAGPVKSVGCKKRLIKSTFPHYGPGADYNAVAEAGNYNKIVANYINDKDTTTLYGGNSDLAKANTLYMSTGHFQPITTQVKADTLAVKLELNTVTGVISIGDSIAGATSLATGTVVWVNGTTIYLGSTTGTFTDGEVINDITSAATAVLTLASTTHLFNDIEVFGGDCFTSLIDIGYSLWGQAYANRMGYAMWFPCECNANYNLRRGLKVSNKGLYPFGLMGFDTPAGPQLENYSYNLGYSSDGTLIKYPALPVNFKFTGRFPYLTRFAGEKISGELQDSFRKFLINDKKEVDGKLGEINNLRSKDGRTIVWQNHGVSSVPILERQLLSGTDGASTTVGTGGVVDRFDPISSTYGNQHQHGLVETEYGYAWFDMRNRALCIMGAGGDIQEISLIKGLQVFFNNEFNEGHINGLSLYSIYNTNNSLTTDEVPLLGYGIVGVYDPRFKMTYLTFKYRKDTEVDEDDELVTLEAKDFTIGYSHVLDAIIGFYDFTPAIWHNHNDLVLSANNSKNRVYYGTNMPSTNFVIGDTISITGNATSSKNGEYVCIKNLTVASYPAAGAFEPTFVGSIYWVKTNDQSQIWLQTFNTQYLKFYGQVYGHELEIIVNPKTDVSFSAQHMQMKGSSANYTDVYTSNDSLTANDLNIRSTSRFYRFIDGAWFFSLPIPSEGGRLTDYYAKVKFVYKGYVTSPVTSKNVNKVVSWIKTFFTPKR
jgi:hypothetical protein